jgi:glycogen debranching enzyme
MKWKIWIAFCLLVLLLPSIAQNQQIKVAVIDEHIDPAEKDALQKGWGSLKNFNFNWLSFADLQRSNALSGFTHLWYHRTDTAAFDNTEKKSGETIRQFVQKGGNLFLSMEAVPLLNEWKIEPATIQSGQDTLKDEGFGRPAGFHAFKTHPLFHGMNGGVYTTKQKQDHIVRKHGYFGDAVPQKGMVAGIQWTYITFTEENKLLLEYRLGKGRIIAAGAYLYYAADNYNQQHLWQFTENVFRYTSRQFQQEAANYWQYGPRQFTQRQFSLAAVQPQKADAWSLPAPTLQLRQPAATRDFYDLVGRRILWMGKMNGGADEIWIHPYMALRDLRIGVTLTGSDSVSWLDNKTASVEVTPEYLARTYQLRNTTLREIYTVSFDEPNGVAHVEANGNDIQSITVSYASNLRYMWPYTVNASGNILFGYVPSINGHVISGQQGSLNTVVAYSERPIHQTAVADESRQQVNVQAMFSLQNGQALNLYIMGSSNKLEEAVTLYRNKQREMNRLAERSQQYYKKLLQDHLYFTTPDTVFNKGYRWALARTDQFLQTTPGVGTSLMAGFGTTARGWNGRHAISGRPGYAWYFGRDAQWCAMAINDYGDHAMVRKVLETFIQFQDVNGKIFHELSSSGAVHYDAADATPLFIILAGQYLRFSGDTTFIRRQWPAIQKAISFCYTTDTDRDGLIENTNVGHGWIEGGPLYRTHTEFYLAGCWAAALDASAYMSEELRLPGTAKFKQEAMRVKQIIDKDFWNGQQQFFHNGKMRDGSYMPDATVLAAVPIYLNTVTDQEKWQKVASRFGNSYFSTDWGIRIIEDSSKKYRAGSYHAGMVWPLYGGWASLAEYKAGFYNNGYRHIMNNLLQYRHWAYGSIEETLNGDVFKPNGVCSHQAWSETMVLQPAIEGMLGFDADVLNNNLRLSPAFPWHWDFCTVHNIKMGNAKYLLDMKRSPNATAYTIDAAKATNLSFTPVFPLRTKIGAVTHNGKPVQFTSQQSAEGVVVNMKLPLTAGKNEINISTSGGLGLLPVVAEPQPGDSSTGVNIVRELITGNKYVATVSGRPGKQYELKLFHHEQVGEIKGATLLKWEGNLATLRVQMNASAGRYTEQQIEITLQ